jgi:hypothetical protein
MITFNGQPAVFSEVHRLGRKSLKDALGKDLPPYLYFDRPSPRLHTNGEEHAYVFLYRVRFGKLTAGEDVCLPAITPKGEVILAGSQKDFAIGMCRTMCSACFQLLRLGLTRKFEGFNPSTLECLLETLCSQYSKNVLQKDVEVGWGEPYPPEVLTPVMVWMQGYVDWWFKLTGEK